MTDPAIAGDWACPRCGNTWPKDVTECPVCRRTEAADWDVTASEPAPSSDIPVTPQVTSHRPIFSIPPAISGPPSPPAIAARAAPDSGEWGRSRAFGSLFGSAFSLFGWHWGSLLRVAMLAVIPLAPCLFWLIQAYVDYDVSRYMNSLWRQLDPSKVVNGAPERLMAVFLLTVTVGLVSLAFLTAATYGTYATGGSWLRLSVGSSTRRGFRGCGICILTSLWITLRLIPWFLLFIIPGVVKSIAWSFAIPACLAGDAATPEEGIRLSAEATRGRKLYLFGYLLVMWLLSSGLSRLIAPAGAVAAAAFGLGGATAFLLIEILVQFSLGMVTSAGIWLAYADAVSPRLPRSQAASCSATAPGRI